MLVNDDIKTKVRGRIELGMGKSGATYVVAWSILLASTKPLAIDFLLMSLSLRSSGSWALFVPHIKMKCTHPMRMKSGIIA